MKDGRPRGLFSGGRGGSTYRPRYRNVKMLGGSCGMAEHALVQNGYVFQVSNTVSRMIGRPFFARRRKYECASDEKVAVRRPRGADFDEEVDCYTYLSWMLIIVCRDAKLPSGGLCQSSNKLL